MRIAAIMAAVAALSGAPFQCASDPDPNRRMEDTAPEALWELSERFEEREHREARLETLRHLIARYPTSRFAERARLALEEAGEPVPERTPATADADDAP